MNLLELQGISFTYPDEEAPVFTGLSLEVPVGQMGLMASESLQRVMEGEIIENRKVGASYVHRQSVGLA